MASELTRRTGGQDLIPSGIGSWGVFNQLRREMNELLESFPRLWSGSPFTATSFYVPVDVDEKDNSVCVHAELPGLSEQDIELSLAPAGDALIIKGEKKLEHERDEGGVYRAERAYGRFERSVPLPAPVDQDKIEAYFKNGVLTVAMPKAEAAGGKTIPIKTS